MKTLYITLFSLVLLSARARAEDVDVSAFEYVDVVETTDGSIWKGVLVEQTPGVQYKIATADGSLHVLRGADVVKLSKQKNPNWHPRVAAGPAPGPAPMPAPPGTAAPAPAPAPALGGVAARYDEGGGGLRPPLARTGLRIEPSLTSVVPVGMLAKAMVGVSSGLGLHLGYEFMLGNFGASGGLLTRVTWWDLPGDEKDVAWTLETQAYGRATFHLHRVAFYGGGSLGADTNYSYSHMLHKSNTTASFGMNMQLGMSIAVARPIAIDFGLDYHPATDSVNDMLPVKQSIEYWMLHLGVSVRI